MNKYENYYMDSNPELSVNNILMPDENIIWQGKPNRKAFIINSFFTPLTFFAIIWLIFDVTFITLILSTEPPKQMAFVIIPFMALHLMPVWMWLGNFVSSFKRWRNTEYAITDKRILIKSGFWGIDFKTLYYKEIKNVSLRKGMIDSMLGVADLYLDTTNSHEYNNGSNIEYVMFDISEAYDVYMKLQKVVLDIQTDIEFPNAYRPSENPGYNSKYKG